MAAPTDSSGTMTYWFNGQPIEGVQTTNDNGTMAYWFNGVPGEYLFVSAAPPSFNVKPTMFMVW